VVEQKKISGVIALVLFAACAGCRTPPPPPPPPPQQQQPSVSQAQQDQERQAIEAQWKANQQQLDKAVKELVQIVQVYTGCSMDYADRHRTSSLTATELVEAALSACDSYLVTLRESTMRSLLDLLPVEDLHPFANDMVEKAKRKARGAVLQILAEPAK
jgi:hypothetical protein